MYTHQHGKDWAYIIADATPKVERRQKHWGLGQLCDALPKTDGLLGVILLGDDPANKLPLKALKSVRGLTLSCWKSWWWPSRNRWWPKCLSTLIYTSGTTGTKGCIIKLEHIIQRIVYRVFSNCPLWQECVPSLALLWFNIRPALDDEVVVHQPISDPTKIADECIKAGCTTTVRAWTNSRPYKQPIRERNRCQELFVGKAQKAAAKRIAKATRDRDAVPPAASLTMGQVGFG